MVAKRRSPLSPKIRLHLENALLEALQRHIDRKSPSRAAKKKAPVRRKKAGKKKTARKRPVRRRKRQA